MHIAETLERSSTTLRMGSMSSMVGALGGAQWKWRGEQFGRYEAALGTGQAIFFFAPPRAATQSDTTSEG